MHGKCSIALLLFELANAASAQFADPRIESSASPNTALVVGQEVLVTATVFNDGPDAAQNVLVFWSAPVFQPFVLEDLQEVTPECDFEYFDIDPPRFNFAYSVATLPAGEHRSCTVRVRVRVIPSDYQLLVGADAFSPTPDPQPANDSVLYELFFATPPPLTIPATTGWGLMVMVAGALSLGFIHRSGGRR